LVTLAFRHFEPGGLVNFLGWRSTHVPGLYLNPMCPTVLPSSPPVTLTQSSPSPPVRPRPIVSTVSSCG
jgi:hypothetical protein